MMGRTRAEIVRPTPSILYPNKTIYLAGPITGQTYDVSRFGWRKDFAEILFAHGYSHIHCRSPMRGKEILKDFGVLTAGEDYPDDPMTRGAGIVTRDRNDVKTSDAMIACFLESNGVVSRGTFIEYGWADAFRVPVIVVGDAEDPNIKYLMVERIAGYIVPDLVTAATVVGRLLTPGI